MGWDANLYVLCDGHEINIAGTDIGFTHNCNEMIDIVLEEMGYVRELHWSISHTGKSWFYILNGLSGDTVSSILTHIIERLEADPARFESMNPEYGWGSYVTLLPILKRMRENGLKYPSATWAISG